MKVYKKIFTILLIVLILMLIILFFKYEIFNFIWVKEYEHKYKDINSIEKTLSFDKNEIEENEININDFQINLSDFKYNKDEKKLEFNLKFKNKSSLNNVGYILRVYNTEYCLGDIFTGYISLDSAIEYIINYNIFYEENFGYKSKSINLADVTFPNNDLRGMCNTLKQTEVLENGELLHKISFELPEEFIISDILKIELFDLNYQNVRDTTVYKVQEPLTQIRYTININED